MYEMGDWVDIVYTGVEDTGGIGRVSIEELINKNPHVVTVSHSGWAYLKGNSYIWNPELLRPFSQREPDWEV